MGEPRAVERADLLVAAAVAIALAVTCGLALAGEPLVSTEQRAIGAFVFAGLGLGMCEAYPDAFGVFSGYGDDLRVEDGFIAMGDWAGMGFERQNELYALMRKIAA